MHTILYNNKLQDKDFENFKNEMLNICKRHRLDQRALSFAFILWDFRDPQISKILNDKDYWLALDTIAGRYLTVFSLHYVHEEPESQPMQFMTAIPTSLSPGECSNKLVLKYFGNISVSYPTVLFFQVDDEKVSDSFLVSLKEQHVENAYIEIKSLFESATRALQRINPENEKNYSEIFECLRDEVDGLKKFKLVKKYCRYAVDILTLISTIKSVF